MHTLITLLLTFESSFPSYRATVSGNELNGYCCLLQNSTCITAAWMYGECEFLLLLSYIPFANCDRSTIFHCDSATKCSVYQVHPWNIYVSVKIAQHTSSKNCYVMVEYFCQCELLECTCAYCTSRISLPVMQLHANVFGDLTKFHTRPYWKLSPNSTNSI